MAGLCECVGFEAILTRTRRTSRILSTATRAAETAAGSTRLKLRRRGGQASLQVVHLDLCNLPLSSSWPIEAIDEQSE